MAARLARARRATEVRMKGLEAQSPHAGLALRADRPYIVRLDGHKFSTFTRHFDKPWDPRLHAAMLHTTADLLRAFQPASAFTESDEISLVFGPPAEGDVTRMPHMGNVAKILSILAGYCSARFNFHLSHQPFEAHEPEARQAAQSGTAHFDSRVFHVPDEAEAVNNLLWRSYDCKRNSVLMLARTLYTNRQLHRANNAHVMRMLEREAHVSWAAMPEFFKYGALLKKRQFLKRADDPRAPHRQIEVLRGEVVKLNMRFLWQTEDAAALSRLVFAKYSNGLGFDAAWQPLDEHWSAAPSPLPSPEAELAEMLAVKEGDDADH